MTGRKDDGICKRFPRRAEHALEVTIQCPLMTPMRANIVGPGEFLADELDIGRIGGE